MTAKGDMTYLQLEPDRSLVFSKNPNASNPSKTLRVTNLTNKFIAFKVKTDVSDHTTILNVCRHTS